MDAKKLSIIAASLAAARERFDVAEQEASFARNRETSALNELNKAQRAFDDAVAALKDKPPRNSDWAQAKQPRGEAVG